MTVRRDLAQGLYRALAEGDAAALAELLEPGFIGRTADGLPLGLGGEYVGARDMQENFWWRLGRHFRAEAQPEEYVDLPDGGLLVRGTYRGAGRASGRKLEAAFTHVLTFAEGRIVGLVQLTDTAAWHAALGEPGLETIDFSIVDGVAHIRLNRPEVRNAINLRLAEEFLVVAQRIESDPAVRAVLISGNGPALTVGGDIGFFQEHLDDDLGALFARMTSPFHAAFAILAGIDAPIVTAAHGSVAGGGLGFVFAADITLAAEGTRFTTAFAGLGLAGDGGGTWHLPRLVGPAVAKRLYLENRPFDAAEARAWGIVSEVLPEQDLLPRATELAARLAQGPTRAYGQMRRLLRESWGHSLADQLRAETEHVLAAGRTTDAREGILAFLEKRPARFEGK